MVVGEEIGDVDGRVFDVVTDEEHETAAAVTSRTITPKCCIVTEGGRSGRRAQLRLLQAGHNNVIVMQVDFKLLSRREDAVAVELEN